MHSYWHLKCFIVTRLTVFMEILKKTDQQFHKLHLNLFFLFQVQKIT
jgi:hypothetical protein